MLANRRSILINWNILPIQFQISFCILGKYFLADQYFILSIFITKNTITKIQLLNVDFITNTSSFNDTDFYFSGSQNRMEHIFCRNHSINPKPPLEKSAILIWLEKYRNMDSENIKPWKGDIFILPPLNRKIPSDWLKINIKTIH